VAEILNKGLKELGASEERGNTKNYSDFFERTRLMQGLLLSFT